MLVIRIMVDRQWLSRVLRPGKRRLTRRLVAALPAIVVEAASQTAGRTPTVADVMVMVSTYHALTQNAVAWEVTIELEDVEGSRRRRHDRRLVIATATHRAIHCMIAQAKGRRPSYRVACAPADTSGVTVDDKGKVTGEWGAPF